MNSIAINNHTIENYKKAFNYKYKNLKSKTNYNSIEAKKDKTNKLIKRIKNIEIIQKKVSQGKNIIFDLNKIKTNNCQIPKEYIKLIYYNLLLEQNQINLFTNYNFIENQKEINAKMRSILIDWIIEIHFKFNFTDETLSLTVLIIDKYLSKNQVQKKYFQLLGITALLIACKHEEIDVPKIDVFIYITDNAYIKSEVLEMEYKILSFLNFNLLYPSTIKFYEYLSLYFNFDKKMFFLGKYFMESFLLDIKVNKYKPATISCASSYVVMKFFKKNNYKDSYMKKFFLVVNDKENNIEYNVKECAKDISF